MNIDFEFLKKSINKNLKFKKTYFLNNNSFIDVFYAILKEVGDDYIIVEQFYVKSDDNFNEEIVSQKRKLVKKSFEIDKEIPLNV